MAEVSSAARLREIAAELRCLPGVPLIGWPTIHRWAGRLLDEALSLGAFEGPEYFDARVHLDSAKNDSLSQYGPYVSLWRRALAVLPWRPTAQHVDPGIDWDLAGIEACGPIADLIEAEAAKLEAALEAARADLDASRATPRRRIGFKN